MQIQISGKGVDVGDSLRQHIEARLNEGISKYSDRITQVTAVVSRESHMFRIDINAATGTHEGVVVKGRDAAGDVYAAFDSAADKIEKQLRRYKRRLVNHHRGEGGSSASAQQAFATKYVIESYKDEAPEEENAPVIVAEKETDLATLTVSEAVMRMDLLDLPALMFFNAKNGRMNVVYKRADGNISWVDPKLEAAAASAA